MHVLGCCMDNVWYVKWVKKIKIRRVALNIEEMALRIEWRKCMHELNKWWYEGIGQNGVE